MRIPSAATWRGAPGGAKEDSRKCKDNAVKKCSAKEGAENNVEVPNLRSALPRNFAFGVLLLAKEGLGGSSHQSLSYIRALDQ